MLLACCTTRIAVTDRFALWSLQVLMLFALRVRNFHVDEEQLGLYVFPLPFFMSEISCLIKVRYFVVRPWRVPMKAILLFFFLHALLAFWPDPCRNRIVRYDNCMPRTVIANVWRKTAVRFGFRNGFLMGMYAVRAATQNATGGLGIDDLIKRPKREVTAMLFMAR